MRLLLVGFPRRIIPFDFLISALVNLITLYALEELVPFSLVVFLVQFIWIGVQSALVCLLLICSSMEEASLHDNRTERGENYVCYRLFISLKTTEISILV